MDNKRILPGSSEPGDYSTLSLSIPIIFQSLFQLLFGIVDTWFLSLNSDTLVACAGYANQIISVILLTYVIISSSVSIAGAQYIGAKRTEDSRRLSADAVTLTLAVSLVLSAVLFLTGSFILESLRVPASMKQATEAYFTVISLGLAFQGGSTVLTSICRIYGKARFAMIVGILTNLLNIAGDGLVILNPFRYPCDPILGVAAATVLSNLVGFAVMLVFCFLKMGIGINLPISSASLKTLIRYGVPSAGENISYKVSQLVVTVLLTSLGSHVLSARIYAMNIMLFVSLIPNSMGIATGILIGCLFGEKRYDALYRKCLQNIGIGVGIVVLLDSFVIASCNFILHFFTQDPDILTVAKYIICLEAFTLFFKAGNFMFTNSLKGVGDVGYCVALGVLSMWLLGVGLAFLLGVRLELGIPGIYMAFCADEAFRCAAMWRRWRKMRLRWRLSAD